MYDMCSGRPAWLSYDICIKRPCNAYNDGCLRSKLFVLSPLNKYLEICRAGCSYACGVELLCIRTNRTNAQDVIERQGDGSSWHEARSMKMHSIADGNRITPTYCKLWRTCQHKDNATSNQYDNGCQCQYQPFR